MGSAIDFLLIVGLFYLIKSIKNNTKMIKDL